MYIERNGELGYGPGDEFIGKKERKKRSSEKATLGKHYYDEEEKILYIEKDGKPGYTRRKDYFEGTKGRKGGDFVRVNDNLIYKDTDGILGYSRGDKLFSYVDGNVKQIKKTKKKNQKKRKPIKNPWMEIQKKAWAERNEKSKEQKRRETGRWANALVPLGSAALVSHKDFPSIYITNITEDRRKNEWAHIRYNEPPDPSHIGHRNSSALGVIGISLVNQHYFKMNWFEAGFWGFLTTSVFGFAKEIDDGYKHAFSVPDLKANLKGAGMGLAAYWGGNIMCKGLKSLLKSKKRDSLKAPITQLKITDQNKKNLSKKKYYLD